MEDGERVVGLEAGLQPGPALPAWAASSAGTSGASGTWTAGGIGVLRDELGEVLVDEPRTDLAGDHVGMSDQCGKQPGVRGHALHPQLAEGPTGPMQRRLEGALPGDDLGDQGVVARVEQHRLSRPPCRPAHRARSDGSKTVMVPAEGSTEPSGRSVSALTRTCTA